MRHFVQYHNPDSYRSIPNSFGIVTNKSFKSLVGSTVWLITSKGQRPRRYFLCSSFIVDKVEPVNRGRFKDQAVGSKGRDCEIEIGNGPLFPELMRTTGNFGLGLLPLSSKAVVEGLKGRATT